MTLKYFASLLVSLLVCTTTAGSPGDEEAAYRGYLAAFKTMKSVDDRSIERFLSKAAQVKLADALAKPSKKNCNPCFSAEQELKFMKAMHPSPAPDVRPVKSSSAGVVLLTFKWHEAPGSSNGIGEGGSDVAVKVELVQENGWKLKSESWVVAENPGTMKAESKALWSY